MRQEMAYHRFRQIMSWSYWSGIKSSSGIKLAAVAGLVAGFLQAAPLLKGAEVAVGPLGWLLVSGGFYLLAVLWFEWKCPVLLKRTFEGKQEYLGIEGRRWLLALVEDELRRWWGIKPYDLKAGRAQGGADTYQVALGIVQYGNVPAYGGFHDFATARIEHALDEYAQLTSTIIWRDEGRPEELRRFSPGYRLCPLNTPLRSLHLSVMDESMVKAAKIGKEGDLAIRWFETPLTFITELPTHRNLTVSTYTDGLVYLFRTDSSALTFTRIVAQWQYTMRPLSRPPRPVFSRRGMLSGVCPPATEDSRANLDLTYNARFLVHQAKPSTCQVLGRAVWMSTRKAKRRGRGRLIRTGELSALRPPLHHLLLTSLGTVVERVIVAMKVSIKGDTVTAFAIPYSEVASSDLELGLLGPARPSCKNAPQIPLQAG